MVAQVLAYILELVCDRDTERSQVGRVTDAGVEEDLGSTDHSCRQDDLLFSSESAARTVGRARELDCAELLLASRSSRENTNTASVDEDVEVAPLTNFFGYVGAGGAVSLSATEGGLSPSYFPLVDYTFDMSIVNSPRPRGFPEFMSRLNGNSGLTLVTSKQFKSCSVGPL